MATAATAAAILRHEPCGPVIGSRVLNSKEELLSGGSRRKSATCSMNAAFWHSRK